MKIKNLPPSTKAMFSSYKKWSNNNWTSTLNKHSSETENVLERISIFDIWSNALQDTEPTKKLIPEIFMDAYMAIHFASMGLYKYAYVCLRSQLETGLRLVYFSAHPVEFKWWLNGNEWYKSGLQKDVWGEGYNYFINIEFIKKFDKNYKKNTLFVRVKKIYSKLSKYVHSSPESFQTRTDSISPKYDIKQFKIWLSMSNDILDYINVIFILSFYDKFISLSPTQQETILEKGIKNRDFREKLKETIGLQVQQI